MRRNKNQIKGLRGANGKWIEESSSLRDHVNNFFINLFGLDKSCDATLALTGCFQHIKEADYCDINAPFKRDDVRKALFEMPPFKAPGPDGFYAVFYQRMWSVVGLNLWRLAEEFFTTVTLPEGVNDTLLYLILKVQVPEIVTQLRLISLCNVKYKVLTKTMTNRLKKVLPKIIGSYQCSFVPGRQITDNILIY